jgi:diguanylate cyclase (GGDEF)-like protein
MVDEAVRQPRHGASYGSGREVSVAIGRAELDSDASHHAHKDPLTRVANRRALDEYLQRLAHARGVPALLVCDVDGMKDVNDRDGHLAGDALLCGVADVLTDVASEFRALLVARLGGDEFCVVLAASSLAEAERFACTASRRIAGELGPDVSLCWGAAARDGQATTANELIAAADAALLEAKRLGPADCGCVRQETAVCLRLRTGVTNPARRIDTQPMI